jgi:hypothetical protein
LTFTSIDALERTEGRRMPIVRSGGSIPLVAALSARGIETAVELLHRRAEHR